MSRNYDEDALGLSIITGCAAGLLGAGATVFEYKGPVAHNDAIAENHAAQTAIRAVISSDNYALGLYSQSAQAGREVAPIKNDLQAQYQKLHTVQAEVPNPSPVNYLEVTGLGIGQILVAPLVTGAIAYRILKLRHVKPNSTASSTAS